MNTQKPRSGWFSSKFHASLVGTVLLTVVFMTSSSRSDHAFDALCFAVCSLALGYSGTRVLDTVTQRKSAPVPEKGIVAVGSGAPGIGGHGQTVPTDGES